MTNNTVSELIKNTYDAKYLAILKTILNTGYKSGDRTGTGTLKLFGVQLNHNLSEGFPLLTSKKVYWKAVVEELFWFMRGSTKLRDLLNVNIHIWDGDAFKRYITKTDSKNPLSLPEFLEKIKTDDDFDSKWGDLGPIYGKQWRDFGGTDQLNLLIDTLKKDPDSRRLLVNSWNVSELNNMVLPPCHYSYECFTRLLTNEERLVWAYDNLPLKDTVDLTKKVFGSDSIVPTRAISLRFIIRSNDFCLGNPINMASYALLLIIIGKITNMVPQEVIGSLGNTHVYLNHVEGAKEQLKNTNFHYLPTINLKGVFDNIQNFWNNEHFDLNSFMNEVSINDIELFNYQHQGKIQYPLSN